MKEATGELNMTVITIVAIAAIAAFFYAFVWPAIKVSIANSQCEATCGAGNFEKATRATLGQGSGTGGAAQGEATWECVCNSNQ